MAPCPEVAATTLKLAPKKHAEAKKIPFNIGPQRVVARKAVRAHWVETGVAVIDEAIREQVDVAGLKTVFADSDLTNCIAEGDEGGCVASVSLSVTHDDGRLLSFTSTTNLHNAQRTSYATTLMTFAFAGTTWRRLAIGDVVPDVEGFYDAHRCLLEADQGWALVEGAFETYDATSFGKQRCTFTLAELAGELACPLRDLAKAATHTRSVREGSPRAP